MNLYESATRIRSVPTMILKFMGNIISAESVKIKTKKFYFMRKKKRKRISFICSSTQNYFETDTEEHSPSLVTADSEAGKTSLCDREEEDHARLGFKTFPENEDISVVLTASTFLFGLDHKWQHLPLGTIVSALFQYEKWLYVRTAHDQEGYIDSDICLPLKATVALNLSTSAPDLEFESLKLIYETDFDDSINFSERNVDMLYLQANGIRRRKYNQWKLENERKFIKLVIRNDFKGAENSTLMVKKGNFVSLLHNRVTGWFWVKNEQGREGFIPAAIAGYTLGNEEIV